MPNPHHRNNRGRCAYHSETEVSGTDWQVVKIGKPKTAPIRLGSDLQELRLRNREPVGFEPVRREPDSRRTLRRLRRSLRREPPTTATPRPPCPGRYP